MIIIRTFFCIYDNIKKKAWKNWEKYKYRY